MSSRNRTHQWARGQRGVTLIELMIVVVVVAILASIGYPSYERFTQRARRADGQQALMDLAARQERHFGDERRYARSFTELGYPADRLQDGSLTSDDGFYRVAITAPDNGVRYTMTASPIAPHADSECGNLILDSRGTRSISGGGDLDRCW